MRTNFWTPVVNTMEVLRPPTLHRAHQDPTPFMFERKVAGSTQLPGIVEEEGAEKVYVAVGKCFEKGLSLLRWTFKQFGSGKEICILHVHQRSHFIPTLLGRLPASQASPEVVSAFRAEERAKIKKLSHNYLRICAGAKVKASIITTVADQIQNVTVQLIGMYGIQKLVMEALPDHCMKVKKGSSKANYAAKNAPLFCKIWFVNKGKHVWTREASKGANSLQPCEVETRTAEMLRSKSLHYYSSTSLLNPESIHSRPMTTLTCAGITDWVQADPAHMAFHLSSSLSCSASGCFPHYDMNLFSSSSSSSGSGYTSEKRGSADLDSKCEEDSLHAKYREVSREVEESMENASAELLKCKKLDSEALEAIGKVKAFEYAHAHDVKLREEAENALQATIQEQEKLMQEKADVTRNLQKTMRNVAVLYRHTHEATCRRNQAADKLKLIQASIATFQQEKQRIRRQKMEAVRWLERWRSRGQAGAANYDGFIGLVEDLPESAEVSLADLQTATCNFSESFKVGQGGFGCVYKGEMLDRTVAIKKLYSHNMQGQLEFQQEVRVLSKLQHPHLVTLLGACPDAWSLVYEYLPNGSLQDRLFRKRNISPLLWKDRTRIAAEIASGLCFLHSSKPEKIVHGDLKPQNILLDSELSSKICDFGICRLVNEDTLYSPSFHRTTVPKGTFPYADPEYHRTGVLTPKSDSYSFGLIILQLLTGRPPLGLACEVQKAVSCGKLSSVLDPSAGDWPTFVVRRLVDLGLQCCEMYSRERPGITPSLVKELEQLHLAEDRPVPSFFLCPILQEIMHDPQVAADGFTYEGKAMRDWLENGRETSPMTNLKLSHSDLTPNHALRHAIQDWLCKS